MPGPGKEPYVNDYKINLFQIAYLTYEQVNLFQSDFKVVADYFVQKRGKAEGVDTIDMCAAEHGKDLCSAVVSFSDLNLKNGAHL